MTGSVRVGLYGLLGSGNIGNDGSVEAVITWLRTHHPDAVVDAICDGPEGVTARWGYPAVRLHWNRREYETAASVALVARKALGKLVDAVRIAAWVRRHDVVLVTGMGVFETTLPNRPWGVPYSQFLLSLSGRLLNTRVALISVGANVTPNRATRSLFVATARRVHYLSYRDGYSRDSMRTMGLRERDDRVYPDLAYALPTPAAVEGRTGVIGVGVLDYHGTDDDRDRADELHATYLAGIKTIVRMLLDAGSEVRLLTGDAVDRRVVDEIRSDLRENRPDIAPQRLHADPVTSLDELMSQMAGVDAVVATRFHNVLCALKLAKPTVSIGYAQKNAEIMTAMGLGAYCHRADGFDPHEVVRQLSELDSRHAELSDAMAVRANEFRAQLDDQFARLGATLFPTRAEGTAMTIDVGKNLARLVQDRAHRVLTTIGLRQSDDRLNADSQRFWDGADDDRWASNSHWASGPVFRDNDLFDAIGERHLRMFERAARALEFKEPWGRIVDWGCGGGMNALRFAPRATEYLGVDISARSLAECRRQVASVCETPFRAVQISVEDPEQGTRQIGQADVFLSYYVFELLPNPRSGERILECAWRILRPGGLAMIQIKYGDGRWSHRSRMRSYASSFAHMTTWRPDEFHLLASSVGFEPISVEFLPVDELGDVRYAYFLLRRPETTG